MGVIADVRQLVRWNWHRATFVAQTEGLPALIERTAAMAGLARKRVEPQEALVPPPRAPLSAASAGCWPVSLMLLPPDGPLDPRWRGLVELAQAHDVPAWLGEGGSGAPYSSLQLASVLVVCGVSAWPSSDLLREARRLRVVVALGVAASDLGHERAGQALAASDRVIAADGAAADALRAGWAELPPLQVLPADDEQAFDRFASGLVGEVRA